jgi:hypothetical protein
MCEQLTQLHSNAPAHSFKVTRKSVEAAFGRRISELFETFDETPVASGSIAQVGTRWRLAVLVPLCQRGLGHGLSEILSDSKM